MDRSNSFDSLSNEYMTPEQVSRLLHVPLSTLAVWRCTGRVHLPFTKVGRAVRYKRFDVYALLAANESAKP